MTAIVTVNFVDFKFLLGDAKTISYRKEGKVEQIRNKVIIGMGNMAFSCIGDGIFYSDVPDFKKYKDGTGELFDPTNSSHIDELISNASIRRQEHHNKLVEVDKFDLEQLPPPSKNKLFFITKAGIYIWKTEYNKERDMYYKTETIPSIAEPNCIGIHYGGQYFQIALPFHFNETNLKDIVEDKLNCVHESITQGKLPYEFDRLFSWIFVKPTGDSPFGTTIPEEYLRLDSPDFDAKQFSLNI